MCRSGYSIDCLASKRDDALEMAEIVITGLAADDRDRWAELWRGYLDFYETQLPDEIYEHTWQRLIAEESPIRGLGARLDGTGAPLVGIVHYLFHAHAWSLKEVCYLQDLFVDPAARRCGIGAQIDRSRRRHRPRARLPAPLLDDQGRQRDRPLPLRPHRPFQRLHPLRLPARLNGGSASRNALRFSALRLLQCGNIPRSRRDGEPRQLSRGGRHMPNTLMTPATFGELARGQGAH